MIDPGHFASEHPVLTVLEAYLKQQLPGVLVAKFPDSTDPMRIMVVQLD